MFAQPSRPAGPDRTLDAAARAKAIETAAAALDTQYVFPDVGAKMAAKLRERHKAGAYAAIASGQKLAETLTADLQAISHDLHLRVMFSPEKLPLHPQKPTAAEEAKDRAYRERVNHGFDKIERLDGNVGYLKLRGFFPAGAAGETCAAAMTFLANTSALIIDLRENGGGDPAMVALVTSYLYGEEPVHLNDLYFRPSNETTQFWTHAWVPGRRFGPPKPVYVLTSKHTFSAAEEFTYNLKNLKRATIIGETTGGGAHPGEMIRLHDHLGMFLPSGRAINPISKTNWEGTGVSPDVASAPDKALDLAYVKALEPIVAAEKDPQIRPYLQQRLDEARKKLSAP